MTDTKPSKSAKKRAFLALQELGEQLIALSDAHLADMALEPQLLQAVRDAQGMRAHGALRRQKQLIGKLMRYVDPAPIQAALDALAQHDGVAKTLFRDAERWRNRIADEGPAALTEFFAASGQRNAQLERACCDYQATADVRQQKQLRRRIFREVHADLSAVMQKTRR